MVEAWLRGPVDGIPAALMPAAHALMDAEEEVGRAAAGLTVEELWLEPGGAASIGFHLRHMAGSIDRLLTYAHGEGLTAGQWAELRAEADPGEPRASAADLLAAVRATVVRTLQVFGEIGPDDLQQPRPVGRAALPSTVHGILFHLAEHSRRHAGQVITTAKIVRGLDLASTGLPPRTRSSSVGDEQ